MAALIAAALAGFAVLTVEILGIHLQAPWFGTSALVWSQQIGVVLLALALGGWAGGRAALGAAAPARTAAWLLGLGGLATALATLLLPWIARWTLPPDLTLDDAARSFLQGSLFSAILLFAPPVFLLAMVSPLLVEARARTRGAGRAAGEIGAAGTLGSLAGVYGSSLLALPWLGVRATLFLTAAALLLAAGLLLAAARPRALALLAALGSASLAATPDAAARSHLLAGAEVLATRETPYQRLRVIEFPATGERWLQMNEGLDSFQSWWSATDGWSGLYYDLFALAPLYAGLDPGARGATRTARYWVLGAGAGSAVAPVARALGSREWEAVGVELDPAADALGRTWMPLAPEHEVRLRRVAGADARSLLRAAPTDLDFILLDAYARQFEIPAHLATREFFAEAATHLRTGGVLAINVGTRDAPADPQGLLARLGATLREGFGEEVRLHRVPRSRNWVIFARKDERLESAAQVRERMPAGWPLELGAALLPGQSVDLEALPGAAAFTDDRNPLVWLQARSWRAEAP